MAGLYNTPDQVLDAAGLRRRLVLPPDARGWHGLMITVRALDRLERELDVPTEARRALLTEAYGAAWESILLRLRRELGSLPEQDLEEVIQRVWLEIDTVYQKCGDRERFSGYLWTTLRRLALKRLDTGRAEEVDFEPELAKQPSVEQEQRVLATQALRRFAWFHWGSQDNPASRSREQWTHRKGRAAMVEFSALACGLEGRPYGDLVFWNQPRAGDWGQGDGEGDEKWWRNRATYARGKFKKALQTSEGRAAYESILERLRWNR